MNCRPLGPKPSALAKLSYTPPDEQPVQGALYEPAGPNATANAADVDIACYGTKCPAGPKGITRKKRLHKLRGRGKIRILGN